MRFASWLFVGAGLLVAGSAAFVSYRARGPNGRQPRADTIQLAAADDAGMKRLAAKRAVMHQLIDGGLTLLEAAAWFKYINETMSAARDDARSEDAGLSEGERYCRQVIRWAEPTAKQMAPGRAEEVVRRLTAELDADRARDRTLTLPDKTEPRP